MIYNSNIHYLIAIIIPNNTFQVEHQESIHIIDTTDTDIYRFVIELNEHEIAMQRINDTVHFAITS